MPKSKKLSVPRIRKARTKQYKATEQIVERKKFTNEMRVRVEDFLTSKHKDFVQIFEVLEPRDKAFFYMQLMEYGIPKYGRIEPPANTPEAPTIIVNMVEPHIDTFIENPNSNEEEENE